MNKKLIIALIIIISAIGALIFKAAETTARPVTTVEELVAKSTPQNRLRLGAKVAEEEIRYEKQPNFSVAFSVHGLNDGTGSIPVIYQGIMPDTLKAGRDVILEGDFDGNVFHAKTLMTQCPSKYEAPLPGESSHYKEK